MSTQVRQDIEPELAVVAALLERVFETLKYRGSYDAQDGDQSGLKEGPHPLLPVLDAAARGVQAQHERPAHAEDNDRSKQKYQPNVLSHSSRLQVQNSIPFVAIRPASFLPSP